MDFREFIKQMLVPGTTACAVFGALLGLLFAVLCFTIGIAKALVIAVFCLVGAFVGGVKDKKAFFAGIIKWIRRSED